MFVLLIFVPAMSEEFSRSLLRRQHAIPPGLSQSTFDSATEIDEGAPDMRSSFIVCTRDRPDDLLTCVRSIVSQNILPYELIIVDASVASIARRNYEQVTAALTGVSVSLHYCRSSKASLPFQRNLGVEASSGDILFFFDDDVILQAGFHGAMLGLYEQYGADEVGGIQGMAINAPQPSLKGRLFRFIFLPERTPPALVQRMHPSSFQYMRFVRQPDTVAEIEWMSGYCMSFKREVFDDFCFDERVNGYGGEDIEFSYRVSRKYRLLRAASVPLIHTESPVARPEPEELAEIRVVDRHYVFHKNMPQRKRDRVAYLWALFGHVLMAGYNAVQHRDAGYLVGTMRGLRRIIRGQVPSVDSPWSGDREQCVSVLGDEPTGI